MTYRTAPAAGPATGWPRIAATPVAFAKTLALCAPYGVSALP